MTIEPTKPGMPFANSAIAKFLDTQIDNLKGVKTQREIAGEIGYDKPNMISMFKRGEAMVPLEKIPLLAKALGVDAGHLFRLALEQYWPGEAKLILDIFGRTATENEETILLKKWRAASQDLDPASNARIEAGVDNMLEDLFGKERERNKASTGREAPPESISACSPSMFDAGRRLTTEGADRLRKALMAKKAEPELIARLDSALASDQLSEAHCRWIENWAADVEAADPLPPKAGVIRPRFTLV
ncbi:MAG: helix-turn-helix domain-containing protein [Roseiarcus sp.]